MYLSRELTDQSLLAIAQYYGRQNHTTVLHASRQMRQQMESDPALERQVLRIQQSVRTSAGGSRRRS
jgi:chromosomal replication initiator protein